MTFRAVVVAFLTAVLARPAGPRVQSEAAPIDTALARRYFNEAAALAQRDAGRLWGRSLSGPLLFVHAASRKIVAEVADPEGRLRRDGEFYRGTLPTTEPAANSAIQWAGRHWTMILWPLPTDSVERAVLLGHELWHRIQDSLGFPATGPSNEHLATINGRLWLRLEARALLRAANTQGARQVAALQDAIEFRRARRRLFPGADSAERALEMNEGLASFTGTAVALPALGDRLPQVVNRLLALDSTQRFERGFAYQSGPAYGYFLDALDPGWRATLTRRDDLAYRLDQMIGRRAGVGTAATRAAAYGYSAVRREETTRSTRLKAHVAAMRRRFRSGPTLELPLASVKISFDPNQVEALDSLGSVYGSLRISDRWGVLQCDKSGGLISPDFARAIVPAPADTTGRRLTGPGWLLELAPNWRVVPGRRRGDWTVQTVSAQPP
jgi:hypothetical protein